MKTLINYIEEKVQFQVCNSIEGAWFVNIRKLGDGRQIQWVRIYLDYDHEDYQQFHETIDNALDNAVSMLNHGLYMVECNI
jgi:hypothetical protein